MTTPDSSLLSLYLGKTSVQYHNNTKAQVHEVLVICQDPMTYKYLKLETSENRLRRALYQIFRSTFSLQTAFREEISA